MDKKDPAIAPPIYVRGKARYLSVPAGGEAFKTAASRLQVSKK